PDAGARALPARLQHQIAEPCSPVQHLDLFRALDRTHLFQHVADVDEARLRQQLLEPDIDAVRKPAIRIKWAGKPVHPDIAIAEAKLVDALCYRVRPGAAARPDIAHPILGAAPSL